MARPQSGRVNVISMRINDEEELFFRMLVESGEFADKAAALRHFVELGRGKVVVK